MQNNDLYKEYDAKLKEKDFIIQIMKDTKENIIKNIAEKEKENQSAEWETKKSYYLEIIRREQEEKRQFQKEHTEKTQKEMELWKTEWKEQLNELKKENQILKEIEREKIRIENVLQQSNKNTANEVKYSRSITIIISLQHDLRSFVCHTQRELKVLQICYQ